MHPRTTERPAVATPAEARVSPRHVNGGLKRGKQLSTAFLDRAVVAVRLRRAGWSRDRIAEHLGVSPRTVEDYFTRRNLKRIEKEIRARRRRFSWMLEARQRRQALRRQLRSSSSTSPVRPITDDDLLDGPRMRRKLALMRRRQVQAVLDRLFTDKVQCKGGVGEEENFLHFPPHPLFPNSGDGSLAGTVPQP